MSKVIRDLMAKELTSRYRDVQDCLVVDYTRVTATETSQLRSELRKQGARMQVVKNRLAARAFKEIGLGEVTEFLDGPSAIVSGPDIAAVCKLVRKWSQDHKKLEMRGGVLGRKRLGAPDVKRLAELPSMDALRQRMASLVLSPITGILYTIQAGAQQIAIALEAVRKQKEQAAPKDEPPAQQEPPVQQEPPEPQLQPVQS